MKWLSIMLLLLCKAAAVQANTILLPLTPEQGLSQGAVRDLHLDRHGFLWIATSGGINRYDGNKVTELHTRDYRLSEISFNDILEDSQGRLWLSADHTGLYLYDETSGYFELFIAAPKELGHPIETTILKLIEYDKEHLLFVVNQAIYKLKLSNRQVTKIFDLTTLGYPTGWIRNLLSENNQLFIAAFNGLIHLDLQSGHAKYLPHLPEHILQPTAEQRHTKNLYLTQEHLFVGTVSGLYQISRADINEYLKSDKPYTINTVMAERNIWHLEKHNQQLLAATDLGLYQITKADSPELLLCFSATNHVLIDNTIVDFAVDPHGGLWVANRAEGAFYWHPQSEAFRHSAGNSQLQLSSNRVTDIWQQDQTLWLATTNGLNQLNIQDNSLQIFLEGSNPDQSNHVGSILSIVNQAEKTLWLTTRTGIKAFDLLSNTLISPSFIEKTVEDLFIAGSEVQLFDQNSESLIIKQQNKLYQYFPNTGRTTAITLLNEQLPMAHFGKVLGQLDDNSWIISTADQLWRFQPENAQLSLFYQYSDFKPQLNRFASSMQQDNQGTLWVGMQGIGLLGFDVKSWEMTQHFSVDNKLRSNEVFSLLLDNIGDIWFSSRQGLARLEPQNLQIEYFNKADGVPFNAFNDGAAIKLNNGNLLFGGIHGIVTVMPEQLQHTQDNLQVVITDFAVLAGEQRSLHGFLNERELRLSHTDAGLRINFSAMSFHNNHKITYRYWLSGQQNNYYPAQYDSQVLFPQLAPGSYQFHVVAISPLTGEQSAPARLFLTISPPIWRSNLAYLIYILLISCSMFFYWRKRRQQQLLLQKAHQQVQISEQRLVQALKSVNSGVFEWVAKSNTMVSSRLPRMLGTSELMHTITVQQHCSLIHPDDLQEYQKQWQRLIQQPELLLDLTYRMRHQDGRWLWFRDQGRVTETDEQNKPLKILGTYSNITETKANEEKARLFGEAFQQTRDWVVILDNRQRVIAANQSFSQAFGGIEPYIGSPTSHHLGISLVRRRFYTKLLKEMTRGEHWQGEEQVITPDGMERPTLINISAVGEHDVSFYVLVFTDITAQKAAEDELRYMANYDALTGLPNRALLMDRIQHGIEQAKRQRRSLALCFIDLDKFKHINDSLGHDIGDLMLKEVARRLKLTLRDSDTVARLGGDEFVVILEGYKSNDNISHVARKMLAVVSEPMQLGNENVGVSPSIGIALFPDDAQNGNELMKHADVAMYHAKEAGRNNFQFFIKEMNEKAHMQLARETRLRKALQHQEFVNYYQPIIDSAQHSIVGAEVLLRWQSPEGMISPAEFIPLAEELRLIVKMTQQLLERALADMALWRAAGFELYLSVNLSTQHLEQPALAETVLALLEKYQLPAHCLRFEITESALMRDQQSAILTMQALSDSGIKLALDDFGTGYSSLKYLKELPLDAIKIDRSFVQDIGIDHNDETIIDAMLSMASSLGLYCVAEGVETEQQLAFFNKRSCFLIQGFLFSRPLPAAEILALLSSDNFVASHTNSKGLHAPGKPK
ncbi:EAL domain-containing protein [Alishewanella longhuensis]|uniref:EAL domain-containing protein n=1 Tax=Alishewanella longhuensis TaxID=1091037 RepID=UPI001E5940D0|nr:EAL domain-containing protein [Alishewanella longhuensis]